MISNIGATQESAATSLSGKGTGSVSFSEAADLWGRVGFLRSKRGIRSSILERIGLLGYLELGIGMVTAGFHLVGQAR